MADSLVSIVVPAYNRGYCILRTLDSVFSQTHQDLEVILVDDGSTDGTSELVARHYAHEPRLQVVRQMNQGVSAARNAGLRACHGSYIALLDSDDVWLPWKIEAQLACLAALPTAGMIWTDMDAVRSDGEVVAQGFLTTMYGAYRWFTREELFESSRPLSAVDPDLANRLGNPRLYFGNIFSEMVLGNLVHTSTVLLRRDRLERVRGFDETLRVSGEDYDFHLRTCREGPVAYLDIASMLYRSGDSDQLTHGSANMLSVAQNFLRTVAPLIERNRDQIRLPRVVLQEVLAEAHAWIGTLHAERGEHLSAMRHLARSLRHKPRNPRALAFLALNLLPLPLANYLRSVYRGHRPPVQSNVSESRVAS
jgi:glycosyltransferase involved in cell wall biosynthesis